MFSSPCTLDSYLKQWNATSEKTIFPYSFFDSIESLSEQIAFPPKDAFRSELKKTDIDELTYQTAKMEYERRQKLSKNHPDRIESFLDWLRYYNLMDVGPLLRAIDTCFESFHAYFKTDPMLHFSLPSLAFKAMFANYEESDPLIFSFNDSHIRDMFRDNIVGGLTNCYHRHINLTDGLSPHNSKFSPSNDRFTSVSFFDVNAMYLATQMQPMPLTPGLEWTLNGKKFKKRVLHPGVSLKSLQWLYYVQATKFPNHQIQHAYHRGEKRLGGYKIDGYLRINDEDIALEFNGCFFHGHCKYFDQAKQNLLKTKVKALKSIATLISIYECEWNACVKTDIPTVMPRILCDDNQSTLLEGIRNGQLYGFVTCDVQTPEALQKEFADAGFLFPFLIRKMELNENHLGPYMKSRFLMQDRKLKAKTVVQTYNASRMFLHTELVRFYIDRGLEISNLNHFIQYIGGRSLKKFADQITQMRKDATYANDETKSLTSKLYGNSGYGLVFLFSFILKNMFRKTTEAVQRYQTHEVQIGLDEFPMSMKKPTFQSSNELMDESGNVFHEISSLKKIITDDRPVHIGGT